jgi:hypothetical protein
MTVSKDKTTDGIKERALSIGLQKSDSMLEQDRFRFCFETEDKRKADELCSIWLGVPMKQIIPQAIKYALAYGEQEQDYLTKIKNNLQPNTDSQEQSKKSEVTVQLDTKTLAKIEQYEMKGKENECAILGINLLYDKLIPTQSKSEADSKQS